ncbi:LysR family transcriptional regulator, partial [Vibrio campbellii]
MYRFLPHSHKAFRVFECVARHMSFTHAAQELYVTQGAVSRQVKQLEEFLGTELVVRKHRSIELTERGKAL